MAKLQGMFRSVEVVSQSAFLGYAIGPQVHGEVETSLDETLSDTSIPAYELLVCGIRPSGLNTITLAPLASSYVQAMLELVPKTFSPETFDDPLGLARELEADSQADPIRDLETRTQAALEETELVSRSAAQALAERDQMRMQLASRETELAASEAAAFSMKGTLAGAEARLEQAVATAKGEAEQRAREAEARESVERALKTEQECRRQLEDQHRSLCSESEQQARILEQARTELPASTRSSQGFGRERGTGGGAFTKASRAGTAGRAPFAGRG